MFLFLSYLFDHTVDTIRCCCCCRFRIGGKRTCSLCIDEYNSSILVRNNDGPNIYVRKILRKCAFTRHLIK